MQPTFVIAGKLNREYILPPSGQPLLDSPGGSLLYTAGGLSVWGDATAGLLGRVGEDYPRQWLRDLEERGFDTRGIRILRELQNTDLRSFVAFTDSNERSYSNAVSHFARRQLAFPKSLLGYQAPDNSRKDLRQPELISPAAVDTPKEYRDVRYVHLCPFDFVSQSQMVNLFKGGSNQTVSLDPAPGYMTPSFWRDLRTRPARRHHIPTIGRGIAYALLGRDQRPVGNGAQGQRIWSAGHCDQTRLAGTIVVRCGRQPSLRNSCVSITPRRPNRRWRRLLWWFSCRFSKDERSIDGYLIRQCIRLTKNRRKRTFLCIRRFAGSC